MASRSNNGRTEYKIADASAISLDLISSSESNRINVAKFRPAGREVADTPARTVSRCGQNRRSSRGAIDPGSWSALTEFTGTLSPGEGVRVCSAQSEVYSGGTGKAADRPARFALPA